MSQRNNSIAFLFWRAGYDVWLTNARGTPYSKKHRTLKPTDVAFWNFTVYEIGHFDLHAVARYVKEKTKSSKIILVGFSMGSGAGLVYASTRSEIAADTLTMIVAIAPPIYFRHMTSPVRIIGPFLLHLRVDIVEF